VFPELKSQITFFDKNIEQNIQQKFAVEAVLKKEINKKYRFFPFLLFGPFGTGFLLFFINFILYSLFRIFYQGKTRTVCEMIKQVYSRNVISFIFYFFIKQFF
jgi:hypothetical protein